MDMVLDEMVGWHRRLNGHGFGWTPGVGDGQGGLPCRSEERRVGKEWGPEEKGTTEDEMVGWHYRLNGHGFGWTPGVGNGQGGLACCCPWGCKELDMTEQLN